MPDVNGKQFLKLGAHGLQFIIYLRPDGTVQQVNIHTPSDQNTGVWELKTEHELVITVSGYALVVNPTKGPWGEYSGVENPGGVSFKLSELSPDAKKAFGDVPSGHPMADTAKHAAVSTGHKAQGVMTSVIQTVKRGLDRADAAVGLKKESGTAKPPQH